MEWVAYPFSSRSSQPRNQTGVSCIAGGFFTNWAVRIMSWFSSILQRWSVSFFLSIFMNSWVLTYLTYFNSLSFLAFLTLRWLSLANVTFRLAPEKFDTSPTVFDNFYAIWYVRYPNSFCLLSTFRPGTCIFQKFPGCFHWEMLQSSHKRCLLLMGWLTFFMEGSRKEVFFKNTS